MFFTDPRNNLIKTWQSQLSASGHIQCWTVMERSTWQLLEAHGSLSCPAEKAEDDPSFQTAYEWMKSAMASAGLSAPAESLTPWWCWVRHGADSPMPYREDLDGLEDPLVLQLSVPSNLVVISCFDLWHFVLNRIYVPDSVEDEAQFDLDIAATEPGSDAAVALEARLQKSWSAIFELDQTKVDLGTFETKSIQGCFWTLDRIYVTATLEGCELKSYE
jgi:hypothetical protein